MQKSLFGTAAAVVLSFAVAPPASAANTCPPGLLAGVNCWMNNQIADRQTFQRRIAYVRNLCNNGDEEACDELDKMVDQAHNMYQHQMTKRGW